MNKSNYSSNSINPNDSSNSIPAPRIKEGLLCPICMLEFDSILQLEEHFFAHSADDEKSQVSSNKLGNQLKGFFGRAKQKILTKNESADQESSASSGSAVSRRRADDPQFYDLWRESQEIGKITGHLDYFKRIRDSRITRYEHETNELLIRLDKLIRDAPSDPEKRKKHERTVVVWVDDKYVSLCPNCAKSFNLSRRRHHCRLCGGIMCHNCSLFLDFYTASKLISPTSLDGDEYLVMPGQADGPGTVQRRGSNTSLQSIVNSSGEPHIRVCENCKELLDRRAMQIEEHLAKPALKQIYEKYKSSLDEARKLTPMYLQMCESFSGGESNCKLRDAQQLRITLMRVAERIDVTSRKILTLKGTNDLLPSPSQALQVKIRLSATQYLRENMLGLPSLPTEEELKKLQEKRRLEMERIIEEEKRQAAIREAELRRSNSPSPSRRNPFPKPASSNSITNVISPDTGWTPEAHQPSGAGHANMDPMLVQINIIRSYIKKAREEHKYDEVNILEANLKELEINYMLEHGNDL